MEIGISNGLNSDYYLLLLASAAASDVADQFPVCHKKSS